MTNYHLTIDGEPVCTSAAQEKICEAHADEYRRTASVGFMPRCGYEFMAVAEVDAIKLRGLLGRAGIAATVEVATGRCMRGAAEDEYDNAN